MLYIVSTPIGNLKDITLRALDALKGVDLILCEDTRVTSKLLQKYEIKKPLLSYHQHSKIGQVDKILNLLEEGKSLALVSDAGTPGISDPGNMLIKKVLRDSRLHGNDNVIVPIPGPSAIVTALSVSGFPTDKFLFLGFPPHKNKRQKFFKEAVSYDFTVAFYESGHRIMKCLKELKEYLGPKKELLVGRELTKQFETIYRGTIDEIMEQMTEERGEFAVIINKK